MAFGPRLGLMPWRRGDELYYLGAGFVQSLEDNQTALYHQVEEGLKLNPTTILQVQATYISSNIHQTWRKPSHAALIPEYGVQGFVTHYHADVVDVAQDPGCCEFQDTDACTICLRAAGIEQNHLLAIPITHVPTLQHWLLNAQEMFVKYQHDLWRHDWEGRKSSA